MSSWQVNSSHTHSLGFRNTSSISASLVPLAGSCMYSHLRMKHEVRYHASTRHRKEQEDVRLPGSEGEGHEDALDSGAGGGQAELHPPVVHQVELHVPTAQQTGRDASSASFRIYIFKGATLNRPIETHFTKNAFKQKFITSLDKLCICLYSKAENIINKREFQNPEFIRVLISSSSLKKIYIFAKSLYLN